MGNELNAALWGAAVGGLLSFLSTHIMEIRKDKANRKKAIQLFNFLHSEWESVDMGTTSRQKEYYPNLLQIADQIRPTMIDCSCENIVTHYLRYYSVLKQACDNTLAGQLGSAGYNTEDLRKIYKDFKKHADSNFCCEGGS